MIWPIPMSEKIYIVTLHNKEDLEGFYNDMEDKGFRLNMKRPISRNTHYWMNAEQAEELKQDPRVWDVDLRPEDKGVYPKRCATPTDDQIGRPLEGTFWKGGGINAGSDYPWGLSHTVDAIGVFKDKGNFGSTGGSYNQLVATIPSDDYEGAWGDGRHVDIVVCDDPVTATCADWMGFEETRFVNYQWFNELNTEVGTIDDDGQVLPTGNVTYYDSTQNPEYHGTHVAGTCAGNSYGLANQANIYGLQILGTMPSGQTLSPLLLYDYLRAFHRKKPINPVTGYKNPTISNHSWGYSTETSLESEFPNGIAIGNVVEVNYQGVQYNSSNPNASGWTMAGLEIDFGIAPTKWSIPVTLTSVNADVEDAIEEGIVIIAAAGNDNFHVVPQGDSNYNNFVIFQGYNANAPVYFNRGMSPASAPNAIMVGSLGSDAQFKRSSFTNFGPRIDVFAPGSNILSTWGDPAVITGNLAGSGVIDTKYPGGGDWLYPISGTSMASPLVASVAAMVASARRTDRFSNDDLRAYLNNTSVYGDMTFDVGGGQFNDNSCRKDSPNKYLFTKNPRERVGNLQNKVGDRRSGAVFPRPKKLNAANGFPSGLLSTASQLEITKEWKNIVKDPTTTGLYQYTSELYIPTNEAGPTGYPVMICLHGNGGTGNVINDAIYSTLGDHIRVGPNGFFSSWNIVDENSIAPDIEYLRNLIKLLKTFTNVDSTRIRISGISNGAALACRAFVEIDDPAVDLIVPIVSQFHIHEVNNQTKFFMPTDHLDTTSAAGDYGYNVQKVPAVGRKILMMQNTNDNVIPYNGGSGVGIQFIGARLSTYRMAQAMGWVGGEQTNGETYQGDASTLLYRYNFNGNQNEIVHCASNGGHAINAKMISLFEEWVESDGQTITMTSPSNTYNINAGAVNANHYILSGTDRNGSVSGNDPVVTVQAGDTINFVVNAAGHPFYIKTSVTGGSGNQVSTGTITGTQGTTSGTLSWNTTGVSPGTYYYVCSFHVALGMYGSIVVT